MSVRIPLVLIGFVLCHMGFAQLLDEKCHDEIDSNKIYGNTPWMASIHDFNKFICHGTLVHKLFVLSSASCTRNARQLHVLLGEYDKSCTASDCSSVNQYGVATLFQHRNLDLSKGTNDISLLRLFGEVTYNGRTISLQILIFNFYIFTSPSAHIRPICIIFDDAVNSGTIPNFRAFGRRQYSQDLQAIDLSQKRYTDCQSIGKIKEANQICAGLSYRDSCTGISGGPLTGDFTYGGKRLTVQFGIVTSGRELCNWASVYTDVTAYKDWIYTILRIAETKMNQVLYEECRTNWAAEVAVRPWEVSIGQNISGALITNRKYFFYCRFTFINFFNFPKNLKVETKFGQSLDVESIYKHPQFAYSTGSIRNNIALLKLTEEVPSSGIVKPICIVMNPKSPRTLTALINLNNESFVGAHKVPLNPIHNSLCSQKIGMTVENNQFCVEQPREFFHPKSGSILGTFQDVSGINRYILIGLMNFHKTGVFVYTNIQSNADWIMETVNEN
ncbi:hypothetical protein KR084_003869 [Drosophila pseudotakahashii]|nr:hypothetical protein KR084_003869 [Drosophila pseudotakahashii]